MPIRTSHEFDGYYFLMQGKKSQGSPDVVSFTLRGTSFLLRVDEIDEFCSFLQKYKPEPDAQDL